MWVFFSLFMEDTMLQDAFMKVYTKFKLHFYKEIFQRFQTREASLTTVETFSMECIKAMGNPTINEFASFMCISPPNAAYKVNSLIKKGYIERQNSQVDRREYHLVLSEKFLNYVGLFNNYEHTVMQRCEERFPPEDVQKFDEILRVISKELMPECDA